MSQSIRRPVIVLLAVLAFMSAHVHIASAQVPTQMHLIIYNGGSIDSLIAGSGTSVSAAWLTSGGDYYGYIPGAPTVVNSAFFSRFPGGQVASGTPVLLVVPASAPIPRSVIVSGQPPAPTAAPTIVPTAISTPTPTRTPTAVPLNPVAPSGIGVVETCIEGDFEGWEGDTVFELCNGEIVVQIGGGYTYHYAYRPRATFVGSGSVWQMSVEGVRGSITVQVVAGYKTCILGQFTGLKSGNIYRLCNGQIWQQTEFWSWTWTWYGPDVLIYASPYGGTKMKVLVSGVDRPVRVSRLQ